jgi:hypothetical protein
VIRRFLEALGVSEHRLPGAADPQADLYRSVLDELDQAG